MREIILTGMMIGLMGCASYNNIERQRRIHGAEIGPKIRLSSLNDGTPAVGIELSVWGAITTNKSAASWAATKDAIVAALITWVASESGILGGGSKKESVPANNFIYIYNTTRD